MNYPFVKPKDIPIPVVAEYDQKLNTQSISSIAGYNTSMMNKTIEHNFFLPLLIKKEAETSSRIEGSNVSFKDIVLEPNNTEALYHQDRSPAKEALGVMYAVEKGKELLQKDLHLSSTIIKSMHKELMQHASFDGDVPGEFREGSMRIGAPTIDIKKDHFAPEPNHVPVLMSDLERYVNDETNLSPVVKIAIIHAQFEIIHPFPDGNGRIGRLLIPLLMKQYGLTDDVSFFISIYLEKFRDQYFSCLKNITKQGDWDSWIDFFLRATVDYGNRLKHTVNSLIQLYMDGEFLKISTRDSQHIKNYIFHQPFFTIPNMIKHIESTHHIQLSNKNGLHAIMDASLNIEVASPGKGKRQTEYWCPKIISTIQKINQI